MHHHVLAPSPAPSRAIERRDGASARLGVCAPSRWVAQGRAKDSAHPQRENKEYDGRALLRSRSYLPLVASSEHNSTGVRRFKSGHPEVFYRVLLRTKRVPPSDIKASESAKQLAECDSDGLAFGIVGA